MNWRLPEGAPAYELEAPQELRRFRFSPRLLTLALKVPKGCVFADIGTDHGLLPIALVTSGRARGAIAIDRAERPLAAARRNLKRFRADGQVEVRKGEGLASLKPQEVQAVLIAGMGGYSIERILERSRMQRLEVETLVLQPNTQAPRVRAVLVELGYEISEELLVPDEKRLFLILVARRGGAAALSPRELLLGPRLLQEAGPTFRAWLKQQHGVLRRHLGAQQPAKEETERALRMIDEQLSRLGE